MEIINWDDLFMTMAYLISSKSKDQRTHIGAVVVGPDREVISMGYNGFPRGVDDDVQERHERGEKQFWMEHAERNAVYNVTRYNASLKNCIMYTQGIPCTDCARGIVQAGIKEVVVDKKWETNTENWIERNERTIQMFEESGVRLRYHSTQYVKIVGFNDGIEFKLE